MRMELGLALRLVAPLAYLSRRALPPQPPSLSPCAPRGSRIRASRREHGVGAVSSGSMTYSVVEEEEEVQEDEVVDDGEGVQVEEEEEEAAAVTTRPRLELIEKPDRSLTLLDEYESEELGTSHCANHRSGEASVLSVFIICWGFNTG